MEITSIVIVHIAVNIVLLVVWAVRLEMRVRYVKLDLERCQLFRDIRIKDSREDLKAIDQKLDRLLEDISRIQGALKRNGMQT